MEHGVIYKFTNKINGKVYVGQTIHEKARYKNHLSNKRENIKSLIDKAISKYGIENFDYEILYRCTGEREEVIKKLNIKEIEYIEKYDCLVPNGYNLQTGGNMRFTITEETRKKLSECGRKQWTEEKRKIWSEQMKGHENWLKSQSEEAKKNIGQATKERWDDPDYKERLSKIIKDSYTEERKQSISEKLKGHTTSEETRKKISMANKGRVFSEEVRKRMSEGWKKKFSEETRAKMSESAKRAYLENIEEYKKKLSEAGKKGAQRRWKKYRESLTSQ